MDKRKMVDSLFGYDEADFVIFSFASHNESGTVDTGANGESRPSSKLTNASKVRADKSVLKEHSTVFDTMFNETWDKKEVAMDDHVDFDQANVFKLFLSMLYGSTTVEYLTTQEAINVYFYAHKYQIQPIMAELRQFLNNRMASGVGSGYYTVVDLIESIKMAEFYSLPDYKSQLDQVRINSYNHNIDEALDLFELCIKQKMFKLQRSFLKAFEPFQAVQLIKYLKIAQTYPREVMPSESIYPETQTLMDKLQTVRLKANIPTALELYQICDDYNLPELKKRVIIYLASKPLEETWSFELIKNVYEQNRSDVSRSDRYGDYYVTDA